MPARTIAESAAHVAGDLQSLHTRQRTCKEAQIAATMRERSRRSFYAAANAPILFSRGVSDLDCGRGDDRRCGQISWSLTPRSTHWRGNDRGEGERSATHANRVL